MTACMDIGIDCDLACYGIHLIQTLVPLYWDTGSAFLWVWLQLHSTAWHTMMGRQGLLEVRVSVFSHFPHFLLPQLALLLVPA